MRGAPHALQTQRRGDAAAVACTTRPRVITPPPCGAGSGARPLDCRRGSQIVTVSSRAGGDVRLVAKLSGKVLDATSSGTANGARLIQWVWHGGNNQRFRMQGVRCSRPTAYARST